MKAFPFLFLFSIFSQNSSSGLCPAICCALWPSSSKALKRTNSPGFGGSGQLSTRPSRVSRQLPCLSVFKGNLLHASHPAQCFLHQTWTVFHNTVLILHSCICLRGFKNCLDEVEDLCISGSFSWPPLRNSVEILPSILILEAKHMSNGSWGV